MQKEYDLTKLKVKRRGLLADLPPQDETPTQVEVNLVLDKEVVDFFKKLPHSLMRYRIKFR
jgi:hypothetical protein